MSDRGYTIGLLIGCVILLSAGLAFTLFELNEYKEGVPDPLGDISVRTTTPPAEPEPHEEPVVEDDELEEPDEEIEEDTPDDEDDDIDESEENGEEDTLPDEDERDDNDVETDDIQE